jgi:hypothetical protein
VRINVRHVKQEIRAGQFRCLTLFLNAAKVKMLQQQVEYQQQNIQEHSNSRAQVGVNPHRW